MPDQQAVRRERANRPGRVGRVRYSVAADRWSWSPDAYEVLGLSADDVGPSTAALLGALGDEDRARVATMMATALHDGQAFATLACALRPADAAAPGRGSWLVLVGDPVCDPGGVVREIPGYVIDVTDRQDLALTLWASAAVDGALGSRAVIEQAKGVLMLAYGMDADSAFAKLVWHSKTTNAKLRDVAERLLATLDSGPPARPVAMELWVDAMLTAVPAARPAAAPDPLYEAGRGALRVLAWRSGETTVVALSGEVDLATAETLDRALGAVLRRTSDADPIVVDLAEVTHLGSVGASVLARYERRCARTGTGFVLAAAPAAALQVLALAAAGLTIYPDVASAVARRD